MPNLKIVQNEHLLMQNSIEIIAVLAAFFSVYFSISQNMLTWPTGLLSAITYFILFYLLHLYGDAFLQIIFFIITISGWIAWKKNKKTNHKIVITRMGNQAFLMWVGIGIVGILGLSFVLAHYTDDSLPLLDATITVCSIIGQVLLCYRKVENWYFWILTNVVSIDVYLLKGIYLTALLYVLFLILACRGLHSWRSSFKQSQKVLLAT